MKKINWIIIATGLLVSCQKQTDYTINNLNNRIYILGHGGLGVGKSAYPFDSYEAVEKAISMGADGSELDIQITKDSVLVCYHDDLLEESTNKSGEIHNKYWDEIKDAEYKTAPYMRYKIASLDQIFRYHAGGGNMYTFDIKMKDPDKSIEKRDIFQRALIRLIEKYHLESKITIEHADSAFLLALEQKKSGLNLFIYTNFEEAFSIAKKYGFKGITVRANEISSEQVSEAHKSGIMVAVFSATRLNQDEIIKKNVDIIQSDDLEDLIRRLK